MTTLAVTRELAREQGLKDDEYDRLLAALGRTPTLCELGMTAAMWSEHCSYKSSRIHLKTLPTTGPRVIQGPGENAGVVDIGDGQAVVFKMESHNHPSFIEPYQGAATGVGGICRDVFTMGARPIALADCLRFGRPRHPRTRHLVEGVVAGIGGYGNAFGVPTIAGDVNFDSSYDGNNLVNAFCLGLAPADRIFYGKASGVGNPILYVGSKTGRDGIHGATMASAEFDENSAAKRPAVQVGDPFMEKLLLEACLELMQTDALIGIQDMGAAGLTSSSVEMAARAGAGVELDLDAVPVRETAMNAYEIMLSESQERMLMVVHAGREADAMAIFRKWDLDAAVIGRVTDSGRVVVRKDGVVQGDVPADLLAEGVVYDRPRKEPAYLAAAQSLPAIEDIEGAEAARSALLRLLATPNIASKHWVYRQYDYNVRHGTVVRPGAADAGVVRVFAPDGRAKAVAVSAGCQSRWVYLDPYEGTRAVVAEAYANLVAVGATPIAVTNCLNFGSPEKPEIMWQFAEAVRGLGDACRTLDTPVISGNVSLYNETDGAAIKPTPMIAMVGLLERADSARTMAIAAGQELVVLGELAGHIAASEYLERCCGQVAGRPHALTDDHLRVFKFALECHARGWACAMHDVSDGGLAIALAESAIAGNCGAEVELPGTSRLDELLFGEAPARFVLAVAKENVTALIEAARAAGCPAQRIGWATGSTLAISVAGQSIIASPLAELSYAWTHGFERAVEL